MTPPREARRLAIEAMKRAGVDYPMASATRIWIIKDRDLVGTIQVSGYAAASDHPLQPIEDALRTMPGVVKVRVIRGPEDYRPRERNLRPQVRIWLRDE